jgi:hypothetical protein
VTSSTRRALLTSLGAGAVAVGAVSVSTGLRSWIIKEIGLEFGADIANTADAAMFANDLMAYLEDTKPPQYWKMNWYFRLKPRFIGDLVSRDSELRERVINLFLLSCRRNMFWRRRPGPSFIT